MLDMLTIAPPRCCLRCGSAALDNGQRAEEIGVHLRAVLDVGRLLDGAHRSVTGVVDEDVDTAEPGNRSRDRLFGVGGNGHIELVHEDPVRRLRSERLQLADRTRGRNEVVAAVQRVASEGPAEARRGACDEPGGGGGHDHVSDRFSRAVRAVPAEYAADGRKR